MNEHSAFSYEELSDFGAVLRHRRKAMGLTMVQVSEYAGIGRNHYSRIEAGVLSPRTAFTTIFKILTHLKFIWVIQVMEMPDVNSVPVQLGYSTLDVDRSKEVHYSGPEFGEKELAHLFDNVLNKSKEA